MLFSKSYQAPLVYVSITMQDLLFCPLLETLGVVNIKSRANILTRVQSKAYTEPSSFSSLFNLPYSKDIHYFS